MRYKYLAYKYTRKGSEGSFRSWESFGTWNQPSAIVWRPPTDVYETREELIIVMELAGMAEDEMEVTLFSDLLVVEGKRKQYPCSEMNACHQLGIKYGQFRSEINIPVSVNSENVKAEYKNGLLKVTIRKIN